MVFLVISRLDFKDTVYDAEYLTPPQQLHADAVAEAAFNLSCGDCDSDYPGGFHAFAHHPLLDAAIIVRCLESAGFIHTEAVEIYGNYTSEAIPMFNRLPY